MNVIGRPGAVLAANTALKNGITGGGRHGARPSPLKRKTPVHLPIRESLNRASIIFVTVCADHKKRILACHDVHHLLRGVWQKANQWLVGRYVIMPDHLHLFCAPGSDDCPALQNWVHYWKSTLSRQWPRPAEQPLWQKSFWDTQLRRGARYDEKWEYVRNNPVRAGLCAREDEWPFQGELNVLVWHD